HRVARLSDQRCSHKRRRSPDGFAVPAPHPRSEATGEGSVAAAAGAVGTHSPRSLRRPRLGPPRVVAIEQFTHVPRMVISSIFLPAFTRHPARCYGSGVVRAHVAFGCRSRVVDIGHKLPLGDRVIRHLADRVHDLAYREQTTTKETAGNILD